MSLGSRVDYYQRIFSAYLFPGRSHLSFWHDTPQLDPCASTHELGPYYMLFCEKANYTGPFDSSGIPLLDYRGKIGEQYNPIAIAHWGLGNYNLFLNTGAPRRRENFLRASHWMLEHLEQNAWGVPVWHHNFDWEYRTRLKAPWYSALAQGQGISLLLRAHREKAGSKFLDAACGAFRAFTAPIEEGGVAFSDDDGCVWFEEYIVRPPTHILNGFIWALWGIYDYWLATSDASARNLFAHGVRTLLKNLPRYDLGFWSLYEQSGTRLKMVASPFYHRLHIVQLRVMHRLTGEPQFEQHADKWENYACSHLRRAKALFYKSAFKFCYY